MRDAHSANLHQSGEWNFIETGLKMKTVGEDSEVRFECRVCDYSQTKDNFTRHIIVKHGATIRKGPGGTNKEMCSVCKTVPRTRNDLERHKFFKHQEGDFEDPDPLSTENFHVKSEEAENYLKVGLKEELEVNESEELEELELDELEAVESYLSTSMTWTSPDKILKLKKHR